jgi:hypothetical protein
LSYSCAPKEKKRKKKKTQHAHDQPTKRTSFEKVFRHWSRIYLGGPEKRKKENFSLFYFFFSVSLLVTPLYYYIFFRYYVRVTIERESYTIT